MSNIWEAGEAGSFVGSDLRDRGQQPAPSESQQQGGGGADSVNNGTQSPVSSTISSILLNKIPLAFFLYRHFRSS